MHKDSGMTVREILPGEKGESKAAPLPAGAPSWPELVPMLWEEIDVGAKDGRPGFKTVRKLLTDRRF